MQELKQPLVQQSQTGPDRIILGQESICGDTYTLSRSQNSSLFANANKVARLAVNINTCGVLKKADECWESASSQAPEEKCSAIGKKAGVIATYLWLSPIAVPSYLIGWMAGLFFDSATQCREISVSSTSLRDPCSPC